MVVTKETILLQDRSVTHGWWGVVNHDIVDDGKESMRRVTLETEPGVVRYFKLKCSFISARPKCLIMSIKPRVLPDHQVELKYDSIIFSYLSKAPCSYSLML